MQKIRTLGMVLRPRRDSAEAVGLILSWSADRGVTVLGLPEKVGRLDGPAVAVTTATMAAQADLLIGLGGDGPVLRAMRLSGPHRAAPPGVRPSENSGSSPRSTSSTCPPP